MICHIRALCAVSSEDLPLRTSVHLSYIAFFVQREIPLKFSVIEKGTLSIFSNFQNSLVSLHYSDFSIAGSSVIGADEELGNLHSLYVDQWDWERVITKEQRTVDFLKQIAGR